MTCSITVQRLSAGRVALMFVDPGSSEALSTVHLEPLDLAVLADWHGEQSQDRLQLLDLGLSAELTERGDVLLRYGDLTGLVCCRGVAVFLGVEEWWAA